MHHRPNRSLVAAGIGVAAALTFAPHVQAAAVISTWDGRLLRADLDPGATVVDCDAQGHITFNGFAPQPPVLCGEIGELSVGAKADTIDAVRTIDLRQLTAAELGRVAVPIGAAALGASTIHGSPLADTAVTGDGGKVFGNGGNDNLYVSDNVTGVELWGGSGNDSLTAFGGTTARLEGGSGNDQLSHQGTGGSIAGGSGTNILSSYAPNVSIFGGVGSDTIATNLVAAGATRVIDAGPGTDRINIRAAGGVFNARTAVDPEPKVSFTEGANTSSAERVELVEIRGSGVQTFDIQMDANTAYDIKPSGRANNVLTIRVPGGVWTVGTNTITAPGMKPVTWRGTVILTVVAG